MNFVINILVFVLGSLLFMWKCFKLWKFLEVLSIFDFRFLDKIVYMKGELRIDWFGVFR